MSLAIDVGRITSVLLADGWHTVAHGSFGLDRYEYGTRAETGGQFELLHGSGRDGVCATGFSFETSSPGQPGSGEHPGDRLTGPLTAIVAVRYRGT